MKVPINPIVEQALKLPEKEDSISYKITKLSKYILEFKRLVRTLETQEPTSYTVQRLRFLVPRIEELSKEIDDWKNNCEYITENL